MGAATTFWGRQSNRIARAGAIGYTEAVPGSGGTTGNNVATVTEKRETRKRTCSREGVRCAQLCGVQTLMQEEAAHPVGAEMTGNSRSHGFMSPTSHLAKDFQNKKWPQDKDQIRMWLDNPQVFRPGLARQRTPMSPQGMASKQGVGG